MWLWQGNVQRLVCRWDLPVQGGSECVEETEGKCGQMLNVKEQEFEVNLYTRFTEQEGLQLEHGNGGAASTGVQDGNWLEDPAADQQLEELNGSCDALRVLPV
jgi:hypothetical protein